MAKVTRGGGLLEPAAAAELTDRRFLLRYYGMPNNIEGKVVVIRGASSGLGEASAGHDFQGYLEFRPLCWLSCVALNHLQLAGNRR
jgi:hypothetical protein